MKNKLLLTVKKKNSNLLSPQLGPEGSWRYRYSLSLSEKRWTSCCGSRRKIAHEQTSPNAFFWETNLKKNESNVFTRIWSTLVWTFLLRNREKHQSATCSESSRCYQLCACWQHRSNQTNDLKQEAQILFVWGGKGLNSSRFWSQKGVH